MSSPALKNALRTATTIRPIRLATGGAADADPAAFYATPHPNDQGLYSHASTVAANVLQPKGTPQQFRAQLLKNGVKPDELKHTGFDERFGAQPQVTRGDVAKHFWARQPKIEEHTLTHQADDGGRRSSDAYDDEGAGEAKYSDYQLPGGENYREKLLQHVKPPKTTLPPGYRVIKKSEAPAHHGGHPSASGYIVMGPQRGGGKGEGSFGSGATPAQAIATAQAWLGEESGEDYKSSHWDQPNVLLHMRLSDRRLPNRQKALHLEELQSDWAQEGRKKGFKGLTPDEHTERETLRARQKLPDYSNAEIARHRDLNMKEVSGIPRGPYVDSTAKWTDLGLKHALHEAAKGGYHKLLVTPGEEQAKRYDLSRHVQAVNYHPETQMLGYQHAESAGGGHHEHEQRIKPDQLENFVGKDVAKKLLETERNKSGHHVLSGVDLKVGGEGMKGYYDKILPGALQKLAQKHDPEAQVTLHGHDLKHFDSPRYRVMAGGPNGADAGSGHFTSAHGAELRRQKLIAEGHPEDSLSVHPVHMSTKVHSLDITPKMRASILKGQTAFATGGAVEPAHNVGVVHATSSGAVKNALRIAASVQPALLKRGGAPSAEPATPAAISAPASQFTREDDHPAWIPTRLVTSKKGTSGRGDIVDMQSFKQTPDLYQKNVDLLRAYPNMPAKVARKSHDAVAEEMMRHAKDNLLDLHDRVPEHIRQRSKLWYDGARRITNDWMGKYGLPDHSIAGALAALSPQKDWYQNVSLAKRVLDATRGDPKSYQTRKFGPQEEATFRGRPSLQKPEYEGVVNLLKGKSLHDLDHMDMSDAERAHAKALWIRMHDETHNDPSHPIITPEGTFGDPVKTNGGANAKVGWGSLGEIAKAVRAIESAHDPAMLSQLMGEKHKVRNFYNNILSPNSKHGDVTIDTHAIAAALMRPLSGNSIEVAHNFGNYPGKGLPTAGGSAITGTQGTYPVFADAYRQAAKERGVKPREMQSITWEAIRGLFPDTFKTKANNAKVDAIWHAHRKGQLSQAQARDKIHELAGGIRPPTWFSGADEANGSTADARALPQPRVRGAGAEGIVSRAGSGPTEGTPSEGLNAQLRKARGGSVNHAPSEAQKAAGNYAKEHISFQGIPIAIENKLGSVRSGRDAGGKPWSCKLPADYGYIKGTLGADGDHVDVYVGPDRDSHLVFVVNQRDHRSKRFDEHKCLLGFKSERAALDCYVKAFSDGKGHARIGSVETMSLDGFKKWLREDSTLKSVPRGAIIDKAMRIVARQT